MNTENPLKISIETNREKIRTAIHQVCEHGNCCEGYCLEQRLSKLLADEQIATAERCFKIASKYDGTEPWFLVDEDARMSGEMYREASIDIAQAIRSEFLED